MRRAFLEKLAVAALAAALFWPATKLHSQDSALNSVFENFGFHSDPPKIAGAKCSVSMNVVQKTVLDKFPMLQKLGLFNQALGESETFKRPNTLSLAFIIQMLPVATKAAYESNSDIDKCSFKQTITVLDDYGNDETLPVATYGFTRAIYKKINWENFPAQNIMKVAVGFSFSPEFQARVSDENQ